MKRTVKQKKQKADFRPTKMHNAPFKLLPDSNGSIDAYGKIVTPSPISDLPEGRLLAIVYGARDRDRCIHLSQPKYVTLGPPDGPADGCGFDPAQFVVWRNLSRHDITASLTTRALSLHQALFEGPESGFATAALPSLDAILHLWLPSAPTGQQIPVQDQLATAWASFGSGGPFNVKVAQILANLINHFFFPGTSTVTAGSLPGTLTILALRTALHVSA